MSAARSPSLRALAQLKRQVPHRRHLHMTGPATFPSHLLKKPTGPPPPRPAVADAAAARPFNTSRAHKAVGDSSTIDFAYLPAAEPAAAAAAPRVPLAPDLFRAARTEEEPAPPIVLLPQISTAAGDTNYSHFADVADGDAGHIDFTAFAARVTRGVHGLGARAAATLESAEGQNVLRSVWEGLKDDLLGKKAVRA